MNVHNAKINAVIVISKIFSIDHMLDVEQDNLLRSKQKHIFHNFKVHVY